ncbi:MAG: 2-amino-4-hydroxy-6-hydroxymethyldihydropteridine diphosphokinase [Pseudomonadales bacterium]
MALVYVSIGSNIDRYRHIAASLDALSAHFGALMISSIYESEAVGFEGNNFLNLVAGFNCDLTVGKLSFLLREIEYDNGRRRDSIKFGSRTLDIDILTYDDCVGEVDDIILPRDEITENAFVLLPLVDVAANSKHPALNKSYAELWQGYDRASQKLWSVDFEWQGKKISASI